MCVSAVTEKKILQVVIALACIVPVSAGLSGVLDGVAMLGSGSVALDSHFRYLSGLLLGIGMGFLSTIPTIELQGPRLRVLTAIVVIGGLGRLAGVIMAGASGVAMSLALVMELVVTPGLFIWQCRVVRRLNINT